MKRLVSIIMPTYNREPFLPDALAAIRHQHYTHWELIIIDDGSTDNSGALLATLTETLPQPVTLVTQKNAGPAAARNKGLSLARGEVVAFYDSDDLWLPDHLGSGVSVLDEHPSVDWVYFACRREMAGTCEVIQQSTFYTNGKPNPLFDCARRVTDDLYKLDNKAASLTQIQSGIDSGLQNSLIRRSLLESFPIPDFRVGEDRLLILQVLKAQGGMAFVDRVTVVYRVHKDNLSDTNPEEQDTNKRKAAMTGLIDSYKSTKRLVHLSRNERQTLNRRLSDDYFWKLGYSICLTAGDRRLAIKYMLHGLAYQPRKLPYWKTLLATVLRLNQRGDSISDYSTIRRVADTILRRKRLLVIGDSHAAVFRQTALKRRLSPYSTIVCDVGGATVSGLSNPNSKSKAISIFLNARREIKPSVLIVLLGKVDTGFVIDYRAAKYGESVEAILERSLDHYEHFLEQLCHSQTTIVLSGPLPTIKDDQTCDDVANARRKISASQEDRTLLMIEFNQRIKELSERLGVTFVSLDEDSTGEDGLVLNGFSNPEPSNHHYDSGKYAELIIRKMETLRI